ncbi:hypothetical protein ACI2K4_16430 [Micromonospora sp. NPDC050397]|uniref:hypothetical protein n=1 Tax=Micromonospora sp. NPDC050397 TaxID=3364279 RepID=UPI00384CA070
MIPAPPPGQAAGTPLWQIVVAVLGAVATLITAVVGGLTLFYQVRQAEPARSAQTAGPSGGPSLEPPNGPSGGPGWVTPSAELPVRPAYAPVWSDTLLFDNNGIDFDVTPPSNDRAGPEIDIYDGSSNQLVTFGASSKNVARWSGASDPTPADCADLLARYAVRVATFDENSSFCVRTGNGRVVLVKFLRPRDGAWEIHATVWNVHD